MAVTKASAKLCTLYSKRFEIEKLENVLRRCLKTSHKPHLKRFSWSCFYQFSWLPILLKHRIRAPANQTWVPRNINQVSGTCKLCKIAELYRTFLGYVVPDGQVSRLRIRSSIQIMYTETIFFILCLITLRIAISCQIKAKYMHSRQGYMTNVSSFTVTTLWKVP